MRLREFLANFTLPSQKTALTPPGWRLRAAYVGPWVAVVFMHGGLGSRMFGKMVVQYPWVTSGKALLGASQVSKQAASPHQV